MERAWWQVRRMYAILVPAHAPCATVRLLAGPGPLLLARKSLRCAAIPTSGMRTRCARRCWRGPRGRRGLTLPSPSHADQERNRIRKRELRPPALSSADAFCRAKCSSVACVVSRERCPPLGPAHADGSDAR